MNGSNSVSAVLLTAILAFSVVYYVATSIISYRKLSHIPGPKLWGLTVLPLFWAHVQCDIYNIFGELTKKYGPLVRIAPNTLLVADPEIIRRMNAPRSPYTKSKWYNAMRMTPGVDNVLSQQKDERHEYLRKRMTAGYSGKENLSLESDIDDCVLELMHLIESKYISSGSTVKPMDFARKIQFFTSDIMSKVAFDAKFNDLADDRDNLEYIHDVETNFPTIFCTCTIPSFMDFLDKIGLMAFFASLADSKLGLAKVQSIAANQVKKRFDKEGNLRDDRRDMLGSFLRHGLTAAEAESESTLQIVAGSDTSATGIRATMLNIMTNPRVYSRLMAEIDAATASGKIPAHVDQVISDAQSKNLPYLQACIKEGLRWFPPITGLLAKKVPKGGDTIQGYFVPEGVSMGYGAHGIHHSAALYGPDEDSFRPERWLHISQGGDEPSWDKIKEMERNNDLVFGYGKYSCLGKSVAMIELNKMYVELLRRFQFTLVDALKPWSTVCAGIHFQKNMWVIVRKRGEEVKEFTLAAPLTEKVGALEEV